MHAALDAQDVMANTPNESEKARVVSLTDEEEFRLLRSLNERNRTLPYGKFFFDAAAGEIHVEYELLGDELQDAEFVNALTTVARLADDHDDVLMDEVGHGRRAADRT